MDNSKSSELYKIGYTEIVEIGENDYNLSEHKHAYLNRKDGRVMLPLPMKFFPNIQEKSESLDE